MNATIQLQVPEMNEDISAKPEVEVAGKINIQEHFHISTEMYTARRNTTAN